MVALRPSTLSTLGAQSRILFAKSMLGSLLIGSSWGRGLKIISLFEGVEGALREFKMLEETEQKD